MKYVFFFKCFEYFLIFRPTTFPPQWTVVPANAQVLYAIPDTTAYDLFDEQHCLAKLEQLRAEPKIVQETDALIELVEKALKKTSGLFLLLIE